jgi:diaminohydroxyphosphoribosylaminopyrimidine deaminase/5-amino-6-(5-phosphoribosylamino)uracil reductase
VIVDSRLETPLPARVLQPPGEVVIYAAMVSPSRQTALEALGAEVALRPGPHAKVDLPAMLADLAQRGVNELHVEAGYKLNGSLVREQLVDELIVYLAPTLIDQGAGIAALGSMDDLGDATRMHFHDIRAIGRDVRLIARNGDESETSTTSFY